MSSDNHHQHNNSYSSNNMLSGGTSNAKFYVDLVDDSSPSNSKDGWPTDYVKGESQVAQMTNGMC